VFTKRNKVLAFPGSYHGSVLAFGGGGSPLNAPFDWVMGRYNDVEQRAQLFARRPSSWPLSSWSR